MPNDNILITGANGQIGSVLTDELRKHYGTDRVLATDIRILTKADGPFEQLDILDQDRLSHLIKEYKITQIYHLAAILSAKGEQNPRRTWDLNMNGLFNVLECARQLGIRKVFYPSSIAVFGPATPKVSVPQETVMDPSTVYGISKQAGEQWCAYYYKRFGLDIRSLRYPGIIGYQSPPGGGTTDYAVDIFHYAVRKEPFECFLQKDTGLPMIYMPDAIRATLEVMEAPSEWISVRSSYNLSGMSFTPSQLVAAIRKHVPDFKVTYKPDFRQQIADSWSSSVDDRIARQDWSWKPEYDLKAMTADMLKHLGHLAVL
ncbi:MAG: NAD-dependent epimerase/dehydratase family protein [Bacteroidota bacterium]